MALEQLSCFSIPFQTPNSKLVSIWTTLDDLQVIVAFSLFKHRCLQLPDASLLVPVYQSQYVLLRTMTYLISTGDSVRAIFRTLQKK